jgi:hypothetical protein
MTTHGNTSCRYGGWSEFIKDFGIGFLRRVAGGGTRSPGGLKSYADYYNGVRTHDVLAETRDGEGMSWGVLLGWDDHDGRVHRHALARAMLAGDGADARRILLDGGLYVAPSRRARDKLNSFLGMVRSPERARATGRIGWHDGVFVLPDETICAGAAKETILLQQIGPVIVAKVVNRTTPKISRKSIFRRLYLYNVPWRRYEGPWSFCETMWSPHVGACETHQRP